MPVHLKWWDDTETILHYEFIDPWDWNEYDTTLRRGRALMRDKNHYVGILNDMTATQKLPTSLLSKARGYISTKPRNTGRVIFATQNKFVIMMFQMFMRVYPKLAENYYIRATLDEAVSDIQAWLTENTLSTSED
ncbi:MAG: hypothetical protein CUN52_10635 [Phototrophicales bacterium]|nr:MAG: hypothetical protein CUN52_10635 [Phototrophicales bacterium]